MDSNRIGILRKGLLMEILQDKLSQAQGALEATREQLKIHQTR